MKKKKQCLDLLLMLFFLSSVGVLNGQLLIEVDCSQYIDSAKKYSTEDAGNLLKDINAYPRLDSTYHVLVLKLHCMAEKENNQTALIFSYNLLGFYFYSKYNVVKSQYYLSKALELSSSINYKEGMADAYCYLGLLNDAIHNYKNSLGYHQKLHKIGVEEDNLRWQADGLVNVGKVHLIGKNYTDAETYFRAGITVYKTMPEAVSGQGWAYSHLGILYAKKGDDKNAEKYINMAVSFWKKIGEERGLCYLNNEMGELYMENNLSKSLPFFKNALDLSKKTGFNEITAAATNNIGKYYWLLNDEDNALIYFKKAYKVSLKDSIYAVLEGSSKSLGELYLKKNKQKEAIKYLQLNIKYKQEAINKKERETFRWLTSEREIHKVELNNLNLTKENELHQMELAQGKKMNILLVVLFLLVLSSLFFAIRTLKERKKKNTKLNDLNSSLKNSIATIQVQSLDIEKKNKLLSIQKKKLVLDLKSKVMLTTNNQSLLLNLHKKIKNSDIQLNIKKDILKQIDSTSNINILEDLNHELLSLHEEFYAKMSKRFPSLTINNLKLCVLIKMNLTTKEIAQLLFITYDSAKIARNRLRKKLNLTEPSIKLITYLNSIDGEA